MSGRKYDIILFGATGFTGNLAAQYMSSHAPKSVKWAIAGRNPDKLKEVLVTIGRNDIDVINANSADKESIDAVAKQAKVILSCAGPFRRHSALLVAACANFGTHYCDITGENDFVAENIAKYHDIAVKSKAKIISCCGFDSVPSDLGTMFVVNHIKEVYGEQTQSVENIIVAAKMAPSGGSLGTAVDIFDRTTPAERRSMGNPYWLVPKDVKTERIAGVSRSITWNKDVSRWTAPFVMAQGNAQIVHRSSALNGLYGPAFQYNEVQGFRSLWTAIRVFISLASLLFAMLFAPTRRLLQRFIFMKPGEGPSIEVQNAGFSKHAFIARSVPKSGGKPHQVIADVHLPGDPGYSQTAVMVSEAALALAGEDLPATYGCITPATGLGKVYLERLQNAGITFTIRP